MRKLFGHILNIFLQNFAVFGENEWSEKIENDAKILWIYFQNKKIRKNHKCYRCNNYFCKKLVELSALIAQYFSNYLFKLLSVHIRSPMTMSQPNTNSVFVCKICVLFCIILFFMKCLFFPWNFRIIYFNRLKLHFAKIFNIFCERNEMRKNVKIYFSQKTQNFCKKFFSFLLQTLELTKHLIKRFKVKNNWLLISKYSIFSRPTEVKIALKI